MFLNCVTGNCGFNMYQLLPAQILGLVVAVLSIIPAVLLLRQFFKTKIRDYLIIEVLK